MPTLKDWTARLALCAVATVSGVDASAGADVGDLMLRDGFETREPSALVLDAVTRTSVIRSAAAAHWAVHLQLPASLAVLGLPDPYPAGPASATLQSGVLLLNFEGDLAGERLAFAAWLQADTLRWGCGYAPPPLDATLVSGSNSAQNTSLPDAILPNACKSAPSASSQVLDVLIGMVVPRVAITEFWMANDVMPASLGAVGLSEPLPIAQARVQMVDGVLVATFAGDLAGQRIGVAPWASAGTMQWVCGHATPPAGATALASGTATAQTTVAPALLPEACL